MTLLNIDIGSRYIKLTETKTTKNKVHLLSAGYIETPQKSIEDGHIYNLQALVDSIKSYLEKENIKTKQVILTVSSSKIISREILLPKAKKKNISQLVELNAADAFPVNMDDYILDYHIIQEEPSEYGIKYRINMVVAPIYVMKQYVELVDNLHLKLNRIDYSSNSLNQLIRKEKYIGNYIVLDIGYNGMGISLFVNGILEFNRHIEYGLNFVIDKIVQASNMTTKEAENYIVTEGIRNMQLKQESTDILNETIRNAFEHIFESTIRYLNFYKSRHKDLDFGYIYLTSGGSYVSDVMALIQSTTELEVKHIQSFNSVTMSKLLLDKLPISIFANCLGSNFSQVNLVPMEYVSQNVKKKKTIKTIASACMVVVLVGIILGLPAKSIYKFSNQANQLEVDITTLKNDGLIALKEENTVLLNLLEQKRSFLDTSKSASLYYDDIIEAMETTMPTDVFYVSLKTSDNKMDIAGIATDELALATLISNIKDMPLILDVHVPGIQYKKSKDKETVFVTFTMTCVLDSEGGADLEAEEE